MTWDLDCINVCLPFTKFYKYEILVPLTNLQIIKWFHPTGPEVVDWSVHHMLDVLAPKRVALHVVPTYDGNQDATHY